MFPPAPRCSSSQASPPSLQAARLVALGCFYRVASFRALLSSLPQGFGNCTARGNCARPTRSACGAPRRLLVPLAVCDFENSAESHAARAQQMGKGLCLRVFYFEIVRGRGVERVGTRTCSGTCPGTCSALAALERPAVQAWYGQSAGGCFRRDARSLKATGAHGFMDRGAAPRIVKAFRAPRAPRPGPPYGRGRDGIKEPCEMRPHFWEG